MIFQIVIDEYVSVFSMSVSFEPTSPVPQCSNFGLPLFLIFINNVQCHQIFANNIIETLEKCQKLVTFSSVGLLRINYCCLMFGKVHCCYPQKKYENQFQLSCRGFYTSSVQTFRVLRILLDSALMGNRLKNLFQKPHEC